MVCCLRLCSLLLLASLAAARPGFRFPTDAPPSAAAAAGCRRSERCRSLHACPAAVADLRAGQGFRRCGADSAGPLVCCRSRARTPTHSRADGAATTARPRPTPRPTPRSNPEPTPAPQSRPRNQTKPAPTMNSRSMQVCESDRAWEDPRANEVDIDFKILDGQPASENEFPYMVAIGYSDKGSSGDDLRWLCGGSLVSERFVLTAAHCFSDARERNMEVRALRTGTRDVSERRRLASDYTPQTVLQHPGFRAGERYNDLALVRTDRAVRLGRAVRPVCLPTAATAAPPPGAALLAAGWGAVDPAGLQLSPLLQKAWLRSVSMEECRRFYRAGGRLPRGLIDSQQCARDPRRTADTCSGDSGGPLVQRTGGRDTLVAVTSFGGNPCGGDQPGVYALVQPALPWIERAMWGSD